MLFIYFLPKTNEHTKYLLKAITVKKKKNIGSVGDFLNIVKLIYLMLNLLHTCLIILYLPNLVTNTYVSITAHKQELQTSFIE